MYPGGNEYLVNLLHKYTETLTTYLRAHNANHHLMSAMKCILAFSANKPQNPVN